MQGLKNKEEKKNGANNSKDSPHSMHKIPEE
jgi:hypothetical protein